eukprot:CAMPEP_0170068240 /NCGR_PEP_ID=MMETSP0019_2-20121128/7281_1 /TAXON_ID=98059 /ORGANISM="Dinobryon sp., Strain UTEXLB2267" /LENGTH=213 /DNA_ID=CAMNT_0010275819 /DNA_START=11 /DNA_END=652 /DNA_ORIENTATION=-
MAILNHHTANLLDGVSASLLISRILQYKNGDVRAMLAVAGDAVRLAATELLEKHSSNPAELQQVLEKEMSSIVHIPHMRLACERIGLAPNAEEKAMIDLIDNFSPMLQLFITSWFVGTQKGVLPPLRLFEIQQMYSSYAEQKHILEESTFLVRSQIETLLDYGVVLKSISPKGASSRKNQSEPVLYTIKCSAATLLKVPSLAQSLKMDLQRFC